MSHAPCWSRAGYAAAAIVLALACRTSGAFADFTFTDITTPALACTNTVDKKGVAFVDYDQDGDPDLCVAADGPRAITLLRNDGGTFVDVTAGDLVRSGSGCTQSWADFDRDGDPDLWLGFEEYQAFLFRNDGGDVFTDITSGPFLNWAHAHSISWVDLEGDGMVEGYQSNLHEPSRLYRWNGTAWSDIATDSLASILGDGIAWGDYDDDGDPDVYLARFSYAPSLMLRNDRAAGFLNVTFGALTWAGNAHSAHAVDYDDDGRLDLFIAVANGQNRLLRNQGSGGFTVTTPPSVALGGHSVSPCWGDYDNDGDQDLFVTVSDDQPCHMFRNDGGNTFTDVTTGPLVGTGSNAGVANADVDRDGDLDLYLGSYFGRSDKLLRNDLANGNHWLQLSLRGTRSNTTPIGAKIMIAAGGRRQYRHIAGCTGFRGHSDYVAHFGIGASAMVDTIQIRWPSGALWDTTGVAADGRLSLVEPEQVVGVPGAKGSGLALAVAPNPTSSSPRFAATLPRAGALRLEVLDATGRHVATLADERREAGTHVIEWSLASDGGERVRPGIYLARLEADGRQTWRKVVVIAP